MSAGKDTVLILGAGINGCALARELVLNRVSVWLVDTRDIASGATAGSSHLIHGGLRYLEYGDFGLVKESLAERALLLRMAPQFVRPLKLWIPSANRLGGSISAPGRFFGWNWWPAPQPKAGRGAWLVRAGLRFYDAYARDPLLPKHEVMRVSAGGGPRVNPHKYHWLCSYYDAQVAFPERFVMAIVEDARRLANIHSVDFQVFTYHRAVLNGKTVQLSRLPETHGIDFPSMLEPAMIVNATGAWVDETLQRLHVPSPRLMGGTKGSHLFTFNQRLRELLGEDGIYAEARDGRPIFITPLADTVLVGTTDERFEGSPEEAVATEPELNYLLDSVNAILPDAALTPDDVDFHYSAVRPLPYVSSATPGAITRRHAIVKHETATVPMISLVGGKLTTMRSLAESGAAVVLKQLGRPVTDNSREWLTTGAVNYPADRDSLPSVCEKIAVQEGFPASSVAAVWRLCGDFAHWVLSKRVPQSLGFPSDHTLLDDTLLPFRFVRWTIHCEQARTLADLVERRLMLLYHQRLTKACLRRLAELLIEADQLPAAQIDAAVADEIARLKARYGKHVE
jgi:glycerol-3-phosphate dehydrogenase